MRSPLTRVLLRIFARGFFREHAGLFLFVLVMFASYFFFVQVLNETHLEPADRIKNNLLLTLTMLSSPVMVVFVLMLWILYIVKSLRYITSELRRPANEFLTYSSTAASRSVQWQSWFVVTLVISLPLFVYGIFTMIVGTVYEYYAVPVLVLFTAALFAAIGATILTFVANRPLRSYSGSVLLYGLSRWYKPLWLWLPYYTLYDLKISLAITKLLSLAMLTATHYWLAGDGTQPVVACLSALGIATVHAAVFFQWNTFSCKYLTFALNFPYSKTKRFTMVACATVVLTLPESLVLLKWFDLAVAMAAIVFHLATAWVFLVPPRAAEAGVKPYITRVFFIFICLFAAAFMYALWWWPVVGFAWAMVSFHARVYRQL